MSLNLERLNQFEGRKGPILLIIMDGVGIGKNSKLNALKSAKTEYLDNLILEAKAKHLYTELNAHGTFVGLPSNDLMGNSEVGHNAIGAGRIVEQRSTITKKAIESGELFNGEKWKKIVSFLKDNESVLHFIGLLSDGYVHSHISHLIGLLNGSRNSNIKNVRVHILLDGRDVLPQSSLKYVEQLNNLLNTINKNPQYNYKIASGGGRMHVTMDRYFSDWNVVKRGWDAHVCGLPEINENYKGYFSSAKAAIEQARANNPDISDQYLPSFVIIDENEKPIGKMEDNDVAIFFNFRGDRAIEISKAFDDKVFTEFKKECKPDVLYYGMMLYDDKLKIPKNYFLEPPTIENTLTSFLCTEDIKQFSIAETHKFGHIKYFFLGNRDKSPCPNLDKYVEIKSDPSEMIESNPKMKAYEVKNKLIEILGQNKYQFLRVNFANGDMVGHTGNFESAKVAAETVSACIKDLVEKVKKLGGISIVTADHGNLEDMEEFKTSHTLNDVIFVIVDSQYNEEYEINSEINQPGLGNIAATILNLMGYNEPKDLLPSLIKFGT
jgi:2,3-bisphosphoglycerate-independent phosphoglycerate mutase